MDVDISAVTLTVGLFSAFVSIGKGSHAFRHRVHTSLEGETLRKGMDLIMDIETLLKMLQMTKVYRALT